MQPQRNVPKRANQNGFDAMLADEMRNDRQVRSQPAKTFVVRKESAVILRAQLQRHRGKVERYSAWIVLFVSFVGSVVAFNGGWLNVAALKISIAGTLAGLILQIALTYLEWHYYDKPAVAWGARSIDTITTAIGYGSLLLVPLVKYFEGKSVSTEGAILIAWLIIGIASFLVAWFPESRLVE